jgi:hypothetical protein
VTLLFPNYWDSDNFVSAGRVVTVPSASFQSEFFASEPAGKDTIIAIVSSESWEELENLSVDKQNLTAILSRGQMRNVLAGALTRSAIRGVRVRPRAGSIANPESSDWAMGKIQVDILR